MGAALIPSVADATAAQKPYRKPRIFLVQPNRTYIDAMKRYLRKDFEIVGASDSVFDITCDVPLDLILIDSDFAELPEAYLADVSLRSGALVCVLSVNGGRGLRNWWVPSFAQIIPKYLTQQQFIETLLSLT